ALRDLVKPVHRFANKMFRRIARFVISIHLEEVRRVDHGRENIAIPGHADDVLPGMSQIYRPLPRHDPENVQRQQYALGMETQVSPPQEIGYDVRPLPFRMYFLEGKAGVFLVTFGREA